MELSDEQFALICRRVEEGKVKAKVNEFDNISVGPFVFNYGTVAFAERWLEKMPDGPEKEKRLASARKSDHRYTVLSDIMKEVKKKEEDELQSLFLKQLENL